MDLVSADRLNFVRNCLILNPKVEIAAFRQVVVFLVVAIITIIVPLVRIVVVPLVFVVRIVVPIIQVAIVVFLVVIPVAGAPAGGGGFVFPAFFLA